MILIDSMNYENTVVRFYNGIDFNKLIEHSKDGSDGFIFCFINSWIKEVTSYNRELKISSIVNDDIFNEFDWESIDNNYISIYQTDGVGIDVVYETVRNKLNKNQFPDMPWIPISSGMTGAWNISNNKGNLQN
jgi:hypothetical protein